LLACVVKHTVVGLCGQAHCCWLVWSSTLLLACVVKHTVVALCGQAHCCNWQPGYYLPHHTWCGLNSFKTARGPYLASLHRWGLANLFVNVDSCRPRTL